MSAEQIQCTMLTISDDKLVLPNAAVAEIIPIQNIINVANKPAWMLGYLDWRGNSVPLVSFETLAGVRMPSLASGDIKAAILYSISDDKEFSFMSILVRGAPKILAVGQTDVMSNKEEVYHPAVEQKVLVCEENASIVDLEKLENLIKDIMS
jgi:chemosensory pili system protein ChpC